MLDPADTTPDRVRPLLRTEYDQLVASGAFDDERVELLGGMLVTTRPQDAPHAHTVQRLAELLFAALTGRDHRSRPSLLTFRAVRGAAAQSTSGTGSAAIGRLPIVIQP